MRQKAEGATSRATQLHRPVSLLRTMAAVPVTVLSVLLGALVDVQAKLPLPEYVKPCSIKDAHALGECARARAQEILPHVMEGDSRYGVPALDPLLVPRLVVDDGTGPLGVHLVATDVSVHGIRSLRVDRILHSVDPPEDVYEVSLPEVLINSKYNISGRILLLPITGFGDGVLSLKNVKLTYRFKWQLQKLEDGEIYFLPRPGAHLDIETEGLRIYLDNLFNGEKTLGENTNKFMNENWQEVFAALRPAFAEAISDVITSVLYGMFKQVPYKDAFLDTGL